MLNITGRALLLSTGSIALVVLCACSNEPQQVVTPSVPVAPRYAQIGSGHGGPVTVASIPVPAFAGYVAVCVSADSPPGNYTFTIQGITPGDENISVLSLNPAFNAVTPDNCKGLAYRDFPLGYVYPPVEPVTSITYSYTGNTVIGGANFAGVTCHDDAGLPVASVCPLAVQPFPTVVGSFTSFFGTFARFSFVQTPTQQITALRVMLADLDLKKGTDHKLDDMLEKIQKEIDKEHTPHACKELDHFIKEVSDHEWKKVGIADGTILVARANAIKAALGC